MILLDNILGKTPAVSQQLHVLAGLRSAIGGLFFVTVLAWVTSVVEGQSVDGLEARAIKILTQSCADCHTPGKADESGLEDILNPLRLLEKGLIDPEMPSRSKILRLISNEESPIMPPLNAPLTVNRPNEVEQQILAEWIASLGHRNAPSNANNSKTAPNDPTPNDPVSHPDSDPSSDPANSAKPQSARELDLIDNAVRFLDTQPIEKQPSIRFFSFRNLYQLRNSSAALNPNFAKNSRLSDDHIALVKALNSLSWNSDFATMDQVPDSKGLLVWVDITTLKSRVEGNILSWTEDREWREILKEYRYGYEVDHGLFHVLQNKTGTRMPIIRADWFIANALRPPLYHQLLQIPENEKDLQKLLGLDIERNILQGEALRIGFTESKVSTRANRLIERHPITSGGYYWKSYDFLPSTAAPANADAAQSKRLLKEFPTGPQFNDNKFTETAFDHDGGEIIFSLPNQLQGYMLVQADGTRIDEAPQDLVNDGTLVSGSPSIVNGLSCIACHSQGMIDPPPDEIRDGTSVKGKPLDFVRRLHRPEEGKDRLKSDKERFLRTLSMATEKWNPEKGIASSAEPISRIAKNFNNASLGIAELASELGVEEDFLSHKLTFDRGLKQIVPLTENQTIKREDWQSFRGLQTRFQQAIRYLELGTPWKMSK